MGESAYVIVTSTQMTMVYCIVSSILIAFLTLISHYSVFSFAQTPDNSDNNLKILRNSISLGSLNKEINNTASLLYQLKIGNALYPVGISSNGRQLNNLLYDTEEKSILLIMAPPTNNNTSNNGTLVVDIPRVILDSQLNNKDQNFTVTIDGHPTKFVENTKKIISGIKSNSTKDNTTSSQNSNYLGDTRELAIEFAQDSEIIRITGTNINESLDQTNQTNSNKQSVSFTNAEQQNFLIAVVSASTGVIVSLVYFLYRKNKIKFITGNKRGNA
jgi:hypothetical protein